MEARFDILPQDLAAFGRFVATNRPKTGAMRPLKETAARFLFVVTLVLQFFVGPIVVFLLFPSKEAGPAALLIGGCQTFIGIGQFICWMIFHLVIKSPGATVRKGHDKGIRVVIDSDWFRSLHHLAEVSHRWTDINKIGVTVNHMFILVTSTHGYIVPRRAFADRDTWIQFRDTARSYFESANTADDNPY